MPEPTTRPPEREVDVLRGGLALFRARLPRSWETTIEEDVRVEGSLRADAMVRLRNPEGAPATLVVEAKRFVEARDLPRILEQLSRLIEQMQTQTGVAGRGQAGPLLPMIVARYLSPRTRERLEDLGTNYADATGNLQVIVDRPALFLRDVGAQRDPWRGPGRPRGSFKGPVAARVVRALADFRPPMTVPELVERSGASTGATYRMVEFLEREAYIEREPRGPITRVDWRRMLERWSEDYGFVASNPTSSFLQPRGLPVLLDALRSISDVRYAVTGSVAAEYFARYAAARLAMVYVDDPDRAADKLGLRPVDGAANVLLAAPKDNFVYERARVIDGLIIAAPSQVAVDLLTSPGRGPSEAVALLEWMEANERAWRG